VSAYPLSNVYWTHNFRSLASTTKAKNSKRNKKLRETNKNGREHRRKLGNRNLAENSEQQMQLLNHLPKYSISEQSVNETYKTSAILVNVESEEDLGVYECFSNNSAGFKATKFYIYGDQYKPTLAIERSSTSIPTYNINSNKGNRQLDSSTRLVHSSRMYDGVGTDLDDNLLIDEKLITKTDSDPNGELNREIKFDLTTVSNPQTSSANSFISSQLPVTLFFYFFI
jgi:hypothetical protein